VIHRCTCSYLHAFHVNLQVWLLLLLLLLLLRPDIGMQLSGLHKLAPLRHYLGYEPYTSVLGFKGVIE
jgi:hypothetical protein